MRALHLLTGLLVLTALLLGAAPGARAESVNAAVTEVYVWDSSEDISFQCAEDDPLYLLSAVFSGVTHVVTYPDGTVRYRESLSGTFDGTPVEDGGLPSYTGRLTASFQFVFGSNGVTTLTNTFTIHGNGSDGSQLRFHVTVRLIFSDAGTEVVLEHVRCS